MKNTGLKHRFYPDVRTVWLYHHSCLVCTANRWDALHHVISPSTRFYKDLECNRSVYNSCPIHNYTPTDIKRALKLPADCHIGNESFLSSDRIVIMLLKTIRDLLTEYGYKPQPIDLQFLEAYAHLYR